MRCFPVFHRLLPHHLNFVGFDFFEGFILFGLIFFALAITSPSLIVFFRVYRKLGFWVFRKLFVTFCRSL
jgi:hypothetical protein